MQVIPVINVTTFEEIREKIKLVEKYVDLVQIDVADGILTPNKTWNNPEDLLQLETSVNIEAHLMLKNPERVFNDWAKISSIKRILVHLEATDAIERIFNLVEQYDKELGIAINLETPVEKLAPYLNRTNFFQILAVQPGLASQNFNMAALDKIKALKALKNDVIIEVDGGITIDNAKLIKKAGADILASASYIFNNSNVKEAIESLRNI